MRKKRGEGVLVLLFASALKIGFWGLWVAMVGVMLMEIPCMAKHFSTEKQPHWDRVNKEEMRTTKKTGAFPFRLCFNLGKPWLLGGRWHCDSREKVELHESQMSSPNTWGWGTCLTLLASESEVETALTCHKVHTGALHATLVTLHMVFRQFP